jgi:hypothetical protein
MRYIKVSGDQFADKMEKDMARARRKGDVVTCIDSRFENILIRSK